MKMEDHFKESLKRAVANEPPVEHAWDRFERRVRRGRSIRLFAAIATAAAVIVASAIVVPKLGKQEHLITPSTNQPTPSQTATPTPGHAYAGWQNAANLDQHWTLRYPPQWTSSSFEAVFSFQPPGVEPLQKGLPTFSVNVRYAPGERAFPPPADGTGRYSQGMRTDGRAIYRAEQQTGGGHVVTYRIDWSPAESCHAPMACPGRTFATLVVTVRGDTDPLWTTFHSRAEMIVDSVRYLGGTTATPTPVPS